MDIEVKVEIDAPLDRVWRVMSDVERWPEWTASVERVSILDERSIGPGSNVRILQPRLRPAVWSVTVFEPGTCFEWETASFGLRTIAGHRVTLLGDNKTLARLTLRQTGLLPVVLGLVLKRVALRYMRMEANGLKKASETRQ